MSRAPLENLKKTTQFVTDASTPEAKAAYLDQAFELFKQETEKLAGAYWHLQKKFEAVNLELQNSNDKLKNSVSELKFATNYLDNILGQMTQGLLFIDLTGTITTYNQAAVQLLGPLAQDTLFKPFWDIFTDDLFGFSLKKALQQKKAPSQTFISLKNRSREIETSINFIVQENTQGVIILLRDITELRRLQVLAARNDRLKELGEMAAMVAHEIRNPLGGIKGFASLLARDLESQPALAKMAGYIIEGTDTLNRLVSTVLNYSRPIQLQLVTTDLSLMLTELIEHVKADSSINPAIHLKLLSDKTILAPIDPAILKGAILNLMVNAIQAMPNGGLLTLELNQEKQRAVIKIKDTGIGIASENMHKLFSPFFTTRSDGNGFGLAEVYKVIQAHDGAIEAESAPDVGTTFTIKLPLQVGTKNGN